MVGSGFLVLNCDPHLKVGALGTQCYSYAFIGHFRQLLSANVRSYNQIYSLSINISYPSYQIKLTQNQGKNEFTVRFMRSVVLF